MITIHFEGKKCLSNIPSELDLFKNQKVVKVCTTSCAYQGMKDIEQENLEVTLGVVFNAM